uniref:Transposase n=1 Tax=Steinernema glaseri TaxID=37863 RepID=A0A1I7YU91_9BILA
MEALFADWTLWICFEEALVQLFFRERVSTWNDFNSDTRSSMHLACKVIGWLIISTEIQMLENNLAACTIAHR